MVRGQWSMISDQYSVFSIQHAVCRGVDVFCFTDYWLTDYSLRSVSIGSTFVARRAGSQQANRATVASRRIPIRFKAGGVLQGPEDRNRIHPGIAGGASDLRYCGPSWPAA